MTITHHPELIQGSDEWLAARCGLLTASEMDRVITAKTLKVADNAATRKHLWELLAQRITGYVEPRYVSDAMLRGRDDEILARAKYSEMYAPVTECGFVTNDKWGFTLGCSPDGLVGGDGGIEAKSRDQAFQVETIVESVTTDTAPSDFMIQIQTCLLVTERKWWDFISYSGGLPMATIRVFPDERIQTAILEAAGGFEKRLAEKWDIYLRALDDASMRLVATERKVEQEISI